MENRQPARPNAKATVILIMVAVVLLLCATVSFVVRALAEVPFDSFGAKRVYATQAAGGDRVVVVLEGSTLRSIRISYFDHEKEKIAPSSNRWGGYEITYTCRGSYFSRILGTFCSYTNPDLNRRAFTILNQRYTGASLTLTCETIALYNCAVDSIAIGNEYASVLAYSDDDITLDAATLERVRDEAELNEINEYEAMMKTMAGVSIDSNGLQRQAPAENL